MHIKTRKDLSMSINCFLFLSTPSRVGAIMKFKNLAMEWRVDVHAPKVTDATSINCGREIYTHLNPKIGDYDIANITPKILLSALQTIQKDSPYLAKRLLQRVDAIYVYANVMGYIDHNPAHRLSSFLVPHAHKHYSYLSGNDLLKFFADIDKLKNISPASLAAFYLIVYTAVRRSEACKATRAEFDLDKRLWTIPAHRTKMRREHTVALSEQVVKLLQAEFARIDSPWAFTSPNTAKQLKPIDPWSPWYIIKKSGWNTKQTIHGFRHLFSTHAHEASVWTIDAIEISLSHKIGGVRGVYNHATMLDERRRLMQWYADEVDKWRGAI